MATVTGYTAEKMDEISDSTVIDGHVDGDDLILVRRDLVEINAGSVRGPQGDVGPAGNMQIVTSGTRPGSPAEGIYIHETDTDFMYYWNGSAWVYRGGMIVCTSGTRPAAPFEGLKIYETDTDREYLYTGSAWLQKSGPPNWQVPTLLNSWVNVGTDQQTVRYAKVDGIVEIQGTVKSGGLNTAVFTLPAGYRPALAKMFSQVCTAGAAARMDVQADGDVMAITGDGSLYYSLSATFRID